MAAEVSPGFTPGALAHPAFEPLRPWLRQLRDRPDLARLNALACGSPRPPMTATGLPIRFCAPDPAAKAHYESRIHATGCVDTRPGNLHDLFNALAWLAFPLTKAALNARHAARLPADRGGRGPLRDLLTLVDEGGMIVACADPLLDEIEGLVRDFRWQALYWDRRAALLEGVRFVLLGHSAYEKALAPYPGITCKALFVAVPPGALAGPPEALTAGLDRAAAAWVDALPESAAPRQLPPLPAFGYPGWLPGSRDAGFYADRRWFRPGRAESLGTRPDSV